MQQSKKQIVANAKGFMAKENIDAWAIYDFKGSNPIFQRIIGRKLPTTRRCLLFIPRKGTPKVLAHVLDKELFAEFELRIISYSSRGDMENRLQDFLKGSAVVAMEYSPKANIPYIGRVDAGTIELFAEKGVRVVSSGDLFQYSAARWSEDELKAHVDAAKKVSMIKDQAFELARRRVSSLQTVTEFDIQDFIMQRFTQEEMITDTRPIVAVNENTVNPHYEPTEGKHKRVKAEDLLLLDLSAKTTQLGGVYADITWMAYFGKEVPEQYAKVFDIVADARDRVVATLAEKLKNNEPCQGWELDNVARDFITKKDYGSRFIHRTGHSLGANVHGDSVNLDNYESKDTRLILPGIGFTVEPGIYLEKWGIRSEIDVYINKMKPIVTTPIQNRIKPLS